MLSRYKRKTSRTPGVRKHFQGRKMDEHRFLMEQSLGRRLNGRMEQVHHIDGNKANNDLSNLKVVTPKEHAIEHGRWKHPVTKPCAFCGCVFTPHPTHRERAKMCSQECRYAALSELNRRPSSRFSMYRDDAPPSRVASRKSGPK
jgi:hypothetical protein